MQKVSISTSHLDQQGLLTSLRESTILKPEQYICLGNSGDCFKDRIKGITILKGEREGRTPIIDLKRIFKFLLYGLGFGVVVTGVVFLFENREEE